MQFSQPYIGMVSTPLLSGRMNCENEEQEVKVMTARRLSVKLIRVILGRVNLKTFKGEGGFLH